jgi:hypothetical protein
MTVVRWWVSFHCDYIVVVGFELQNVYLATEIRAILRTNRRELSWHLKESTKLVTYTSQAQMCRCVINVGCYVITERKSQHRAGLHQPHWLQCSDRVFVEMGAHASTHLSLCLYSSVYTVLVGSLLGSNCGFLGSEAVLCCVVLCCVVLCCGIPTFRRT